MMRQTLLCAAVALLCVTVKCAQLPATGDTQLKANVFGGGGGSATDWITDPTLKAIAGSVVNPVSVFFCKLMGEPHASCGGNKQGLHKICFDFGGLNGDVFRMYHDSTKGISVDVTLYEPATGTGSYIDVITVSNNAFHVEVTRDHLIFLGNTYPWGQLTTIAIGLQYSISGDAGVDLFTLHLGSYQFTFQRATFNGIEFLNLGQDGSVSNLDGLLGHIHNYKIYRTTQNLPVAGDSAILDINAAQEAILVTRTSHGGIGCWRYTPAAGETNLVYGDIEQWRQ